MRAETTNGAAGRRAAALVVSVVDLQRHPGETRSVAATVELASIDAEHEALGDRADVELTLTSTLDDIELAGSVEVRWRGACRRCLTPLDLVASVPIEERFSDDDALVATGDALPIVGGQIDLRDLVRDELLLTAAEERLCRPACRGLCPQCGADLAAAPCGCETPAGDERWSVLDQLRDPGSG